MGGGSARRKTEAVSDVFRMWTRRRTWEVRLWRALAEVVGVSRRTAGTLRGRAPREIMREASIVVSEGDRERP